MNLFQALRLHKTSAPIISLLGAGGKTTALFQLARQFMVKGQKLKVEGRKLQVEGYKSKVEGRGSQVFVTTTTHLGVWQTKFADWHIIVQSETDLKNIPNEGVILFTGKIENEKASSIDQTALEWLREKSRAENIPLLIEADGSKQKPIKAPAEHEPPIPEFTDIALYVVGLSAIGRKLSAENVHRPEIFAQLTNLALGQTITPESIVTALTHPQGGLKNIPPQAKRIALLNQADTPKLQAIGGSMAQKILKRFDSVLVGSLHQNHFQTFEKTAGIILAAGDATRFGAPKQLLDWKGKPFVRQVAETALKAGLEPVLVVSGAHHAEIESCLTDFPVKVIQNPNYKNGQSESIKLGINNLPENLGSAIFLLADQPQIPVEALRALKEKHTQTLAPIIAPLVLEERRANPVLFDKTTFLDLLQLTGDVGGRAIFAKHKVEYLPWHDDILTFDVDTPADYEKLKART